MDKNDIATMKFIDLSKEDRADVLDRVSTELNIRQREVVEKDWWVTAVLRAIFCLPYAQHLSFKGGTSLSKCWHLIDRFSEDIDGEDGLYVLPKVKVEVSGRSMSEPVDEVALDSMIDQVYPKAPFAEQWKADYENMRLHMIYGESDSFEELVAKLKCLNDKIKGIRIVPQN